MTPEFDNHPLEHFDAVAQSYEKSTGGCTRELAERFVPLLNITSDSVVLDNACGTGIVTDVLLQKFGDKKLPEIHAVDGAPKMVEISEARFVSNNRVRSAVMPGENLDFPDSTFTHSITNLGFLFFDDASKAAAEVWRTLKPGGIAVVTNWKELGYLPVLRKLQQEIRPEEEPFNVPIEPEWFEPHHTEKILRSAGFQDVGIQEMVAHWGAESLDEVSSSVVQMFGPAVFRDWSDGDRKKAMEMVPSILKDTAVSLTRNGTDCVGVEMKAIVAICKK
ncbi:methyltransferase type 11 [Colletotrichum karsti]|uniref:Methyltransferase type 11 n=1 Tax=Colletotrichum karsti TaxID=1095194 RepID=A0A9P6I9Q4_9PEZI|nr:methyltransferase type 11 [Colletotrichum karsti]KAF9878824.1 methyltransferase type 11 [Colletotrichum karsti]